MTTGVAIVGAAESDLGSTGRSILGLQTQAVTRALADAGLTLADVDGIATTGVGRFSATQLAFNIKKGSIPVRLDVDVSSMDVCAQRSSAVLKDPANQVESMEILTTPNFQGAMQDAVTQYWNTPSMSADAFIEKVTAAMKNAS